MGAAVTRELIGTKRGALNPKFLSERKKTNERRVTLVSQDQVSNPYFLSVVLRSGYLLQATVDSKV